ncbi:MAG: hypothetical protein M5U34_16305 [Chloroflexi bacterium]|nr:hypothetical protein [Chloroflexota bacterium]
MVSGGISDGVPPPKKWCETAAEPVEAVEAPPAQSPHKRPWHTLPSTHSNRYTY